LNYSFLHLGSNIGNRQHYLELAINHIAISIGVVVKKSAIYETEAWGNIDQNDFLNQAIAVNTNLSPEELLDEIHSIEYKLGRQKEIKWGPRIIDIDIIFYNDHIINHEKLIIPHPFMADRNFVLEPLKDITGDFIHPIFNKTIHELYAMSKDKTMVNIHPD
jgi:2-amino-4-hydroxy-6-hydroxymethyldihydropteridine diphosphokinase